MRGLNFRVCGTPLLAEIAAVVGTVIAEKMGFLTLRKWVLIMQRKWDGYCREMGFDIAEKMGLI